MGLEGRRAVLHNSAGGEPLAAGLRAELASLANKNATSEVQESQNVNLDYACEEPKSPPPTTSQTGAGAMAPLHGQYAKRL